ncbi:MAG TPA: hypothetical protein VHV08_08690, partial [Pirellulales bacterium]|nr:hypothetical protein [Pirellulales bacterium]
MASETLSIQEVDEAGSLDRVRSFAGAHGIVRLLLPLASLQLTVVLFALAIFLIFVGTLAQVDKDIWDVMSQYFRAWFAWIDLQVFFPKSFFAGEAPKIPGGFWFPGGWLIGGAMGINLLAAHTLRFKIQAHGWRLAAGLAVIALGAVLTWVVIEGGSGKDTIEGAATFHWSTLWGVLKASLVILWLAGAYTLVTLDRSRTIERWLLIAANTLLGALVVFVFVRGDQASLGDSSMRILWQLIKGGLAAVVLLGGCLLVFRKRAGIVLLHAGVALVMANELVVYSLHVEGQMHIQEGETVNYVQDIRTVELAVVDPSNPKTDDVVVIPRHLLQGQEMIRDAELPFDVEVVKYLLNASLKRLSPDEKNLATAGAGLQWALEERRAGSGTDMGGKVDLPAAYVKLSQKPGDKPIGTYLVGLELLPQKIQLGDKTYDLALRFKRNYKPYSMQLRDVRFDKYLGTQTAKNYSS